MSDWFAKDYLMQLRFLQVFHSDIPSDLETLVMVIRYIGNCFVIRHSTFFVRSLFLFLWLSLIFDIFSNSLLKFWNMCLCVIWFLYLVQSHFCLLYFSLLRALLFLSKSAVIWCLSLPSVASSLFSVQNFWYNRLKTCKTSRCTWEIADLKPS